MPKLLIDVECGERLCTDCRAVEDEYDRCATIGKTLSVELDSSGDEAGDYYRLPECLLASRQAAVLIKLMDAVAAELDVYTRPLTYEALAVCEKEGL